MVLVFLLYLFFASTFTLGKAALMYVPPLLFIGVHITLGGILLLTYSWAVKRSSLRIAPKDYGAFANIIFFHIYLSYILEFWGMEQISSAKACLMYNMSPFFTAVLSYFFLSERFSKYQILGLIISFVGFVPVLIAQLPHEAPSLFFFFSVHELALIASVAASAYGWIIMKQLTSAGYSFIFVNGVGMLGGGLCALMTSPFFEGAPALREVTSSMPHVISFLSPAQNAFFMLCVFSVALIIVSNVIYYNLYGYLLSRHSPTFLSLAGLMTPLFGALLGWFFLEETITGHFFVTLAIVSLGIVIFYKGKK